MYQRLQQHFFKNLFFLLSDGIDGKQARRTQTSGPVGELFDHGLDSWSTMFITTALYSVFGSCQISQIFEQQKN